MKFSNIDRLYEKYLELSEMCDFEGGIAFRRSDKRRFTSWEEEQDDPYRNRPMLALPPRLGITTSDSHL